MSFLLYRLPEQVGGPTVTRGLKGDRNRLALCDQRTSPGVS
jgi:hypothetical protein